VPHSKSVESKLWEGAQESALLTHFTTIGTEMSATVSFWVWVIGKCELNVNRDFFTFASDLSPGSCSLIGFYWNETWPVQSGVIIFSFDHQHQ
jgi:hypothetical protein